MHDTHQAGRAQVPRVLAAAQQEGHGLAVADCTRGALLVRHQPLAQQPLRLLWHTELPLSRCFDACMQARTARRGKGGPAAGRRRPSAPRGRRCAGTGRRGGGSGRSSGSRGPAAPQCPGPAPPGAALPPAGSPAPAAAGTSCPAPPSACPHPHACCQVITLCCGVCQLWAKAGSTHFLAVAVSPIAATRAHPTSHCCSLDSGCPVLPASSSQACGGQHSQHMHPAACRGRACHSAPHLGQHTLHLLGGLG